MIVESGGEREELRLRPLDALCARQETSITCAQRESHRRRAMQITRSTLRSIITLVDKNRSIIPFALYLVRASIARFSWRFNPRTWHFFVSFFFLFFDFETTSRAENASSPLRREETSIRVSFILIAAYRRCVTPRETKREERERERERLPSLVTCHRSRQGNAYVHKSTSDHRASSAPSSTPAAIHRHKTLLKVERGSEAARRNLPPEPDPVAGARARVIPEEYALN